MIDSKGYRPNVGIILCNDEGHVFWAKRAGMNSWQFPQGGIDTNEDAQTAMYRELREETGLEMADVRLIGRTRYWLRYNLPKRYIRRSSFPVCIGQKQIWYLLHLIGNESKVRFDRSDRAEFDGWRWVQYWDPLKDVVYFKRKVYRKAMTELGAMLLSDSIPINSAGYLSNDEEFILG